MNDQSKAERNRSTLGKAELERSPIGVGKRIEIARLGWTQDQIAGATGVARNTVARYESGQRAPDTKWLLDFCTYTGIRPDWLLFAEGPARYMDGVKVEIVNYFNEIKTKIPLSPDIRLATLLFCRIIKNNEWVRHHLQIPSWASDFHDLDPDELNRWRLWVDRGIYALSDRPETAPSKAGFDDFALVPLYDVWAAAGTGTEIEQERVLAEMAFRRYWLAKMGLHAEQLVCIRARGDSMSPTILDGDILLVDRQRTGVDRDSIYIVRSDDGLRVKRLQRLMGGGVRVSSDNRAYAEEVVSVEQLVVVGQVVWKGGAI